MTLTRREMMAALLAGGAASAPLTAQIRFPPESARGSADISALPLLRQRNLNYAGAFRFPEAGPYGASPFAIFSYAWQGFDYNPVNNSLFAMGHTLGGGGLLAEISIPALGRGPFGS